MNKQVKRLRASNNDYINCILGHHGGNCHNNNGVPTTKDEDPISILSLQLM